MGVSNTSQTQAPLLTALSRTVTMAANQMPQQESVSNLAGNLERSGVRTQSDFVRAYGTADKLTSLLALQVSIQREPGADAKFPHLKDWVKAALEQINRSGATYTDAVQTQKAAPREKDTHVDLGLLQKMPSLTEAGNSLFKTRLAELARLLAPWLKSVSSGKQAAKTAPEEWQSYISEHAADFAGVDVDALVQAVLRECYQENLADLKFFAEKVKWLNAAKAEIRKELTRARQYLAGVANDSKDAPLEHLFFGKSFNLKYGGPTSEIFLTGSAENLEGIIDGKKMLLTPEVYGNEGVWNAIYGLSKLGLQPEDYGTRSCTGSVVSSSVVNSFYYFLALQDLVQGHSDNYPAAELVDDLKSQFGIDASTDAGGVLNITMPDGTKFVDSSGNGMLGEADLNFGKAMATMADQLGLKSYDLSAGFDKFKVDKYASAMTALMTNTGSQYPKELMTELFAAAFMYCDSGTATSEAGGGKPIGTKDQLETYIKDLEFKLATVGDDAQLANVDLQNMLQKQQQTLQLMADVSKMLHDTALAIIRKISG